MSEEIKQGPGVFVYDGAEPARNVWGKTFAKREPELVSDPALAGKLRCLVPSFRELDAEAAAKAKAALEAREKAKAEAAAAAKAKSSKGEGKDVSKS